eukprot:m.62776 g.62776  ORF g.62776 m.62776 type:complete len:50 (-) comp15814_c0_seq1:117-266(-)
MCALAATSRYTYSAWRTAMELCISSGSVHVFIEYTIVGGRHETTAMATN